MLNLVKRNDPCPCGSGKKYKKCCYATESTQLSKVFFDELDRTLQTFFDEYPSRKDAPEFIQLADVWLPALEGLHPQLIEAIALEHYLFIQRPDLWDSYMQKVKKNTIRPTALKVYELWSTPQLVLGQVVENTHPHYIKVRNLLTNEELGLRRETNRVIPNDMLVFAFVLRDGTLQPDEFVSVSMCNFFAPEHLEVIKDYAQQYQASEQSLNAYLAQHHLHLWELLCKNGYNGEEFTSFETNVLQQVETFLTANDRDFEAIRILLEDYLVEERPSARKEAAIAAGAVRYAMEASLIEPLPMTIKQLGEAFAISPASLTKYYQAIKLYHTK